MATAPKATCELCACVCKADVAYYASLQRPREKVSTKEQPTEAVGLHRVRITLSLALSFVDLMLFRKSHHQKGGDPSEIENPFTNKKRYPLLL